MSEATSSTTDPEGTPDELENTKLLFEALANARDGLKADRTLGKKSLGEKVFLLGSWINGISFGMIILIVMDLSISDYIVPNATKAVPLIVRDVALLLLLLIIVGMMMYLIAGLITLIYFYFRDGKQKAAETCDDVAGYIKQGNILSKFDSFTLEDVRRNLQHEKDELIERGVFIESFIKGLPSAVRWFVIFIIFTLLFSAKQLENALTAETVTNFSKAQEAISNLVFAQLVTRLAPEFIHDLLMYALVITVVSKTFPVIIAPIAARRIGRYRDYIRLIEQALEKHKTKNETNASAE